MDLSLDGEDEDLMILKEVLELTGFSREKIRRWRKLELIPEPKCRLGPYRNAMLAWDRSTIIKWWREFPEKFPWVPPANDNTPPVANDNQPPKLCANCPLKRDRKFVA